MAVDPQVLTDLHEQLTVKLNDLVSGQDWLGWLSTARQFHRYSPQNQMLLAIQGAQGHVASYRTWQRIPAVDGGTCQVAKGEHGMTILAPMTVSRRDIDEVTGDETVVSGGLRGFKPVKVFHQAQLVSPPVLSEPPIPQLLRGDNRHQHVWAAVQSMLEDAGYRVELVSRSPVETWNGRTNFATAEVSVSDHLEPPARLKTLMHEWAHISLGHDTRLTDRRDLQEIEAESTAFLLCATIGVDSATYSVPYLASWASGDPQLLGQTAQTVLASTAKMIDSLEAELNIDLTPDLAAADVPPTRLDTARAASVEASVPVEAVTPLLDAATGSVRRVMAGLVDEADRQRLLDGLVHLDERVLDVATLCAAAGLDADSALSFLTEHGAAPDAAFRAMTSSTQDYLEGQTDALFGEVNRPAMAIAVVASTLTAPPAFARLRRDDRDLLDHVPLDTPDQRASAAQLLVGIGVSATEAADILHHYGLDDDAVAATLSLRRYDPASGELVAMWPEQPVQASHPTRSAPATTAVTPPSPGGPPGGDPVPAAMIVVAKQVATSDDPECLAALSNALGLDHHGSVALWAAAGVERGLAAGVALQRRRGDRAAALTDLTAGWPGTGMDWDQYLVHPVPVPVVSTAHSILQAWNSAAINATVRELP